MMGLAPHLGRQQAHDVVYEACREALGQGRSLFDVLVANPAVVRQRCRRSGCARCAIRRTISVSAPAMVRRDCAVSGARS